MQTHHYYAYSNCYMSQSKWLIILIIIIIVNNRYRQMDYNTLQFRWWLSRSLLWLNPHVAACFQVEVVRLMPTSMVCLTQCGTTDHQWVVPEYILHDCWSLQRHLVLNNTSWIYERFRVRVCVRRIWTELTCWTAGWEGQEGSGLCMELVRVPGLLM